VAPSRRGNRHPSIVPYEVFDASDRPFAVAVGNDRLFARLCDAVGLVGTPEHIARQIMEMAELGVRNLYLMTLQTFAGPEPEIAAFREAVFPRLQAAGYR
jgi:crotonobetainyl-CoA:carnitine CoA-transferase CaiB-like acyl-CoA transferase